MKTRFLFTRGLSAGLAACLITAIAHAQQAPPADPEPAAQQTQDQPEQPSQPQEQPSQPQGAQNQQDIPNQQQPGVQNQNQQFDGQADQPRQQGQQRQPDQRQRVMLGVAIDPDAVTQQGVQIAAIRPGSPAEAANLQPGDVIISIGGQQISSPDELQQFVQTQQIGQTTQIEFLRNGARQQAEVRFTPVEAEAFPAQRQSARPNMQADRQGSRGWLGITLNPPADGDDQPGVEIRRVYPAGPAAQVGLSAGDRIVEIDGQQITSIEQLLQLLGQKQPGDSVEIVIMSDGERQTVNPVLDDRSAFGMIGQDEFGGSSPFLWQDPSGFQTEIPEHDMMLEQHRRLAEQHERLENLLYEVKQDLEQIKQQLGVRGTATNIPEPADTDRNN